MIYDISIQDSTQNLLNNHKTRLYYFVNLSYYEKSRIDYCKKTSLTENPSSPTFK